MFIKSIKLTKRNLVAAAVITGVVLCALVFWLAQRGEPVSQASAALPPVKNMKTNEDRIDFLKQCGWEVVPEAAESQEVLIPETFDEVFERYSEIQKSTGLDLSKYKNRRVMRYTYRVLNHPTGEENVLATLLIHNGRVVGGDVCSTRLDGFMHGLMDDAGRRGPTAEIEPLCADCGLPPTECLLPGSICGMQCVDCRP